MWDALSPSHRVEYCEFVSEAKRPETRVRRAAKTVELMRRRRARKGELKDRGPAPITTAIDEALAAVIAPDLKSMGFRRRRRSWQALDVDSLRIVGVHADRFNQTTSGWFRISFRADWPGLGPHHDRWSAETGPHFRCLVASRQGALPGGALSIERADDPVERRDLIARLAAEWDQPFGRKLVQCATDPAVLCGHLIEHGGLDELLQALGLGKRTDRSDLQERAIARAFETLRLVRAAQPPDGPNEPGRPFADWLHWQLGYLAVLLDRSHELGLALSPADLAEVESVVSASLLALDEDRSVYPSQRATDLIRDPAPLLTVAARIGIDAAPALDRATARRDPDRPWKWAPGIDGAT